MINILPLFIVPLYLPLSRSNDHIQCTSPCHFLTTYCYMCMYMYVHVHIFTMYTFMVQVSGPFTVVLMTVASITLSWSPSSDKQREYSCVYVCISFMLAWVIQSRSRPLFVLLVTFSICSYGGDSKWSIGLLVQFCLHILHTNHYFCKLMLCIDVNTYTCNTSLSSQTIPCACILRAGGRIQQRSRLECN